MGKVRKVHLVYKTHLDIGFTDYAENVINAYRNSYIPRAIELAKTLNSANKKKFVWSVGSWMVDYYLKHTSGEEKRLMEEAIHHNDASHKPEVPDTFLWVDERNNEILVDYCQGYGSEKAGEELLYFAHSADNTGPPSLQEVEDLFKKLEKAYPDAEVFGSDLNAYGKSVLSHRHKHPKVREEIGDTWIHGAMTDPYKIGLYKEYLKEMKKLVKEGKVTEGELSSFYDEMLLIPEHTWGMDVKKYLSDYVNWKKEDFIKAREKDLIGDNYSTPKYQACFEFAKKEFKHQNKWLPWEKRSYSIFEKSHQEQKDYLDKAIDVLSKENQILFNKVKEDYTNCKLQEQSKEYVLYDWAMPDFYKCGFEDCGAEKDNTQFYGKLLEVYKKKSSLILKIQYEEEFCNDNGCPRLIFVKYDFSPKAIKVEFEILQKDADRMPEALWITFFENNSFKQARLKKMEEVVDPKAIVHGGNRNYHCVSEVCLGRVTIKPLHSPLVSLGEKRLYDFNQKYADFHDGIHFNVYNNLWNTNFKLWYEEDIKTMFEIIVEEGDSRV